MQTLQTKARNENKYVMIDQTTERGEWTMISRRDETGDRDSALTFSF